VALKVCTNILFSMSVKQAALAELQLKQVIKQPSIYSPVYAVPAEYIMSRLTQ